MSVEINIRPASFSDIDASVDLMREFAAESLEEYGFSVDAKQAQDLFKQYVETSIIAERDGKIIGVIAGLISTFALNGAKVYQEAAWYVSKQYRFCGVALLRTLEMYCKKWGVTHIIMVHMSNLKSEKLGQFYLAMKYRELEKHYIKQVGA